MKAHFDFHNLIGYAIYTVFLACTCFLIAYFIGWLTDNMMFRKALWFIAVILDLFLSYMWWKSLMINNDTLKKILWAMCALYLFFAIPSAIMYFNNEMVRKETVVTNNNYEIEILKERLKQINNELAPVAAYKSFESKTGYKTRSENVKADKDALVNEQKEKLARLSELTSQNTANGSSNPFKGIEWFMGVIVGIMVLMFYFGEFFILWVLAENKKGKTPVKEDTKNDTDNPPLKLTHNHEFNNEGLPVTIHNNTRYCQYSKCNKPLSEFLRDDAKYCNNNCKQAAYREERKLNSI